MRIAFTGGGTAGHVHPALAIAEKIKKENPNSDILFIGRKGGRENEIIKKSGFRLVEIEVSGLKRGVAISNLSVLKKMLIAKKEAKKILTDFSPAIVFGTGGYVCLPVLLAARSLGIKTVIHESNAYAGLTTKLLAKKANLVMLGFDDAKGNISKKSKAITVGNPIRQDFYKLTRSLARKKLGIKSNEKLIVSFGGSLGAEKINQAVTEYMLSCPSDASQIRHIHAIGKASYKSYKDKYPDLTERGGRKRIVDYISNTPLYLCAADLAITRSGAITLAELQYTGTRAILIPSPNVAANHQLKNAKAMQKSGNCRVLEERELSAVSLKKAITEELQRGPVHTEEKSKENCKTNATEKIYRELLKLVEN